MKLECTVKRVSEEGLRLRVYFTAEPLSDEGIYTHVYHELELPDSVTARNAYRVGRRIVITVEPK